MRSTTARKLKAKLAETQGEVARARSIIRALEVELAACRPLTQVKDADTAACLVAGWIVEFPGLYKYLENRFGIADAREEHARLQGIVRAQERWLQTLARPMVRLTLEAGDMYSAMYVPAATCLDEALELWDLLQEASSSLTLDMHLTAEGGDRWS